MEMVTFEFNGKKLPPLLPWQADFVRRMRAFNVIEAGRRAGKTTLASWIALRTALEGGQVWWVAPTHEAAERGWADILAPMARDFGGRIAVKKRLISFPSGGSVQAHSADRPANLTGSGLSGIVLDEADHPSLSESLISDILLPALVDRGGWLLLISAPIPPGNDFFRRLLEYALSGADPDWFGVRVPSSANSFLPATHLERVRRAMEIISPEAAIQQFDLVGAGGRSPRPFERIPAVPLDQIPFPPLGPVDMGLDVGGLFDPTAVVLLDAGRGLVYHAEEIPPGLSTRDLLLHIDAFLATHPGIRSICFERNGVGAALLPDLMERFSSRAVILDVFMSADLKLELTLRLHAALAAGELRIAAIPQLLYQLRSVHLLRHPSGRRLSPRADAEHDDLFSALLLAFHAASSIPETIGF